MDLIFESQICRQIRERWLMWVPAILKVAEKEKSSSILKILESYDPAALNDSFGKDVKFKLFKYKRPNVLLLFRNKVIRRP